MRELLNRFKIRWCETFHRQSMWPIHGKYECSRCFRVIPIFWEPK